MAYAKQSGMGLTDNTVIKAGTTLRNFTTGELQTFEVDTPARFGVARKSVVKRVRNQFTDAEKEMLVSERWATINVVIDGQTRMFECGAVR